MLPLLTKQVFTPTLEEYMSMLLNRTLVIPDPPPTSPGAGGEGGEGGEGGGGGGGGGVGDAKNTAGGEGTKAAPGEGAGEGASALPYIQKEHMLEKPKFEDALSLQQLKSVYMGCCVASLREEDALRLGFVFHGKPLSICCWRGKITMNLLTSKNETLQVFEKFPNELKAAIKAKFADKTKAPLDFREKGSGGGSGGRERGKGEGEGNGKKEGKEAGEAGEAGAGAPGVPRDPIQEAIAAKAAAMTDWT